MKSIFDNEKTTKPNKDNATYCFGCNAKEVEIVRLSVSRDDETGNLAVATTLNKTRVCVNAECLRRIDLSKVQNWKRV